MIVGLNVERLVEVAVAVAVGWFLVHLIWSDARLCLLVSFPAADSVWWRFLFKTVLGRERSVVILGGCDVLPLP